MALRKGASIKDMGSSHMRLESGFYFVTGKLPTTDVNLVPNMGMGMYHGGLPILKYT
jgi:hypothetical protein